MSTPRKTRQHGQQTGRFIWSFRLELALVTCAVVLFFVTIGMPTWISLLLWGSAIGVGVWQRRSVLPRTHGLLYGSKIKRQIERAARDAGFGELQVGKVASTLPGEWIDVRVPRGKTVAELERAGDAMAGCLRVSDVRVVLDAEDKSHASLSVVRRNSFLNLGNTPWPLLGADHVDVRQGIPFGLDEYGRVFNARLLSRNILLGGAPDSGKSSALRMFAAAAALDPKVKLWMMDAKTGGAEFVHWAPAAERLVRGRDLEQAVELFAALEARVEERSREIVARGEVFVCDDMELDVLMIDELPQFMRSFETDSKAQQSAVKTIRNGIWKLISVGRWAGMITITSAQKPTADIIPSESRDLIDHRFALHCNTRQMSDAIMGDGSGDAPANAAEIPSGQPGVGFYLGDNGVQKIRSFYMSHREALEIAERVSRWQLDEELSALA